MAAHSTYRLHDLIGRGESSTVFRAEASDGRIVAFKHLRGPEAERAGVVERLAAEVALSRRLDHPGLVRLYDSGVQDGRPFLAMELIEGPTLQAVMAKQRLLVTWSLSVVAAVAEALAALHEASVVHRDIKPSNIMLRGETEPVVMDFGVAALAPLDRRADADLVGSPGYLAPELIDGKPFDGKADVFALGVVLHMLLTETRPFDGMADAVMEKIRTTDPPPPSMIDPALLDLDAIVARALAKNPGQRFTAQDLAAALDAV